MLVLIAYDVNTETSSGRKRLQKVAKICINWGQRVQNSVFECQVDASQYAQLKDSLAQIIDSKKDSIRFYNLGNHYHSRIEHMGTHPGYDAKGILMV